MTAWQVVTADRRVTHCPVALVLRDEFTGGGAVSEPTLQLDRQVGGNWLPAEVAPVRTASGIYAWPGLGRSLDPAAQPSANVRVRITLAGQIPLYRPTDDGLSFAVPAYNDAQPPNASPLMPEVVLLLPGPSYPFIPSLRVLRGRILDPAGQPVDDALIVADGVERAISGAGGAFSLPLRWQHLVAAVSINVTHPRSGRAALVSANLPGALARNFDITVN